MCEHQSNRRKRDEVQHGSYHQYYEFRPQDSRPEHLKKCLLGCRTRLNIPPTGTIHLLDVGCNRGLLSNSVLAVVREIFGDRSVRLLGVDIDEELVLDARKEFEGIEFVQADISAIAAGRVENDPIGDYLSRNQIDRFDMVFCFSVLMYPHLNHGDEGLRSVLDYICSKTKVLVLELQSWDKYRDNVRRLKRDCGEQFPLYEKLEWRGNQGKLEQNIYEYVEKLGFERKSEEFDKNEYKRNIVIYSS
ncbi:BCDIN3 domain containing [Culex quinquefasciatus]|uniref:RNA methyltransferase n=1 Tax=Culex quinquefasciatus TaxID=7176 RepID=B0W5N6_CULQU|nr:BCDIN3 domain containing [Culex quinquefasciatus]|eukprot:XP_001844020.1 BCDIN3 domain containing [Culex quinquefasciatus]